MVDSWKGFYFVTHLLMASGMSMEKVSRFADVTMTYNDRYLPESEYILANETTIDIQLADTFKISNDRKTFSLPFSAVWRILENDNPATNRSRRKRQANNFQLQGSCCRESTGTQARVILLGSVLRFQTRRCSNNFCRGRCRDRLGECSVLKAAYRACSEESRYYELMTSLCPRSCGTCTVGTTSPFPGYPNPGNPNPGYPNPGNPNPGYPYPGNPNPGYPNPGNPNPGYPNPGNPNPGYPYPGNPNPGYPNPGNPNPGYPYPGNPNPGYPNPGSPNPGYPYPGNPNPGYPYPGNPNPGYPNPRPPQPRPPPTSTPTNPPAPPPPRPFPTDPPAPPPPRPFPTDPPAPPPPRPFPTDPPAPPPPQTTTTTSNSPPIRKVTVYFSTFASHSTKYLFSVNKQTPNRNLWRPIGGSASQGEVPSFYLSSRSTSEYNIGVYFCKRGSSLNEAWRIEQSPCRPGWDLEFKLYTSSSPTYGANIMFISYGDFSEAGSRVHTEAPCCGYNTDTWFFYGSNEPSISPTSPTNPPSPPPPPYPTNPPSPPPPPYPTNPPNPPPPPYPTNPPNPPPPPYPTNPPNPPPRPYPTYPPNPSPRPYPTYPPNPPPRPYPTYPPNPPPPPPNPSTNPYPGPPPVPGPQPSSPFSRECLRIHNFLRSVHNVPLLQWDPTLASTAQQWANTLIRCAPNSPNNIIPGCARTRNWPHSSGNGEGRPRNTGENIAWDLSSDGSPGEEAVLRWYSEIFDYDRSQPTRSPNGKPIGHLTQLLWKDTKRLGCATAVTDVDRGYFSLKSTWSVAHYSPAGNIRYPTLQENLRVYNEQVPDIRPGSCRSPSYCGGSDMNCIGYSPGSCSCQGGSPLCRGQGCIASCGRGNGRGNGGSFSGRWVGECRGDRSCQCTTTPINGVVGAVCS